MILPLLLIAVVTNTTGEPTPSRVDPCQAPLEALDSFLRPEAARCSRNLGVKIEELKTCTASVADLEARIKVRNQSVDNLAETVTTIEAPAPGWTGAEVFRAVLIGAGIALAVGFGVGIAVGFELDHP